MSSPARSSETSVTSAGLAPLPESATAGPIIFNPSRSAIPRFNTWTLLPVSSANRNGPSPLIVALITTKLFVALKGTVIEVAAWLIRELCGWPSDAEFARQIKPMTIKARFTRTRVLQNLRKKASGGGRGDKKPRGVVAASLGESIAYWFRVGPGLYPAPGRFQFRCCQCGSHRFCCYHHTGESLRHSPARNHCGKPVTKRP